MMNLKTAWMKSCEEWVRQERNQFVKYIQSDRFEDHLDAFAEEIQLDYSKGISSLESDLLNSDSRQTRIGVKLKLILQRCAKNTAEVSTVVGAVGSIFGPVGSTVGVVGSSAVMVVYYAATWYGIVVDHSPISVSGRLLS